MTQDNNEPSFMPSKFTNQYSIVPYVQAKVDSKSKKVVGLEVLARIASKNSGLIYTPNIFFPLLKQAKLDAEFTLELIRNTSVLMQKFVIKDLNTSFNIDNSLIENDSFVKELLRASDEFRSRTSNSVTIELTEHNFSRCDKKNLAINSLKQNGITLSLDDFGKNFSNLNELLSYPYDEVKLDKSLIDLYLIDQATTNLVERLISTSDRLCFKIVAEGIEDELTEKKIEGLNVDYMQGFKFHKPMTIEEFAKL